MSNFGFAVTRAVVVLGITAGCSNNGFDWSKANRPRPATFEAEKTTESNAAVQEDGDALVQEPQPSQSPYAETTAGAPAILEANEAGIEVSADLLPAPDVSIGSVQIFNGKYYIRVSCSKFSVELNKCSNRNQELQFTFDELSIALSGVKQALGKLESLDHSRLSQFEYSSLFSRGFDGSSIEFGPLAGPSDGSSIAEIIIRLKTSHEDVQSLASYRVFAVTRESQ